MKKLLLIAALCMATAYPPLTKPTLPGYVNVFWYGAFGDGVHDDTPAIISATNAAMHQTGGGNFVYFPPTPHASYVIKSPLVLPPASKWVELYFDAPVVIYAPITLSNFYILHGNGATLPASFSQSKQTNFATFLTGQQAAIQIHGGWGIRIENLAVGTVYEPQDGILIDGSSGNITLLNTTVELDSSNLSGTSLHIKGGGLIRVFGGVYSTPYNSSMPSMLIEGDPNECALMGFMKVDDAVILNHGIHINMNSCGPFAQFESNGVFYEDAGGPFLHTTGLGGSLVAGVDLRNVNIADATPNATCLQNEGQAWNFQVTNCLTGNNQAITQGDPVPDLEIWSLGSQPVGQDSMYIYHGMLGIVNTMPSLSPSANAARNAARALPNMNFKIPDWVKKAGLRLSF